MDTSSAAAECVTLFGAAGSALHLFTTGQGNIIGHPVVPVIKITANPKTAKTMTEHIDVDISGVLTREMTLAQAGDRILKVSRLDSTYGMCARAADNLRQNTLQNAAGPGWLR